MARTALLASLLASGLALHAQTLYFPPNGSTAWDTLSPASLGWCPDRIDSLIDFVGSRNTKAFLILKDGKIVIEHYYGTFTQDSLWYWASAGKTLTSMLTGIAQEEGYLDINQPSSTYLGTGWTSCTPQQEAQITVRDQLTMTSGLDDGVPDDNCTDPACLQYLADAGTRWAYHNAPYTLLDEVIANATGTTFSNYFNTRIRNKVGMDGFWFSGGSPYNNVYYSRARSMARYGLLALNHGVWANDTVLHDTAYFTAMTTPSQNLNDSYGYLWWLNGQPSFMVPDLQFVLPGMLMPDAPPDMISG
ncbi:MAG: serine hydrolase, partial [Flavobacteriales bacterium]|nr:serine hydrolase [Flavobacteriales bacterium]